VQRPAEPERAGGQKLCTPALRSRSPQRPCERCWAAAARGPSNHAPQHELQAPRHSSWARAPSPHQEHQRSIIPHACPAHAPSCGKPSPWPLTLPYAQQVAEWLPEAEGAGEAGELPAALAAALRPGALAEYERALAAVFVAGAEVWGDALHAGVCVGRALH